MLSNRVLRDGRLSWRARGILAYLLSQPDNWRTSSAQLARNATEGRDAVRAALDELIRAGYMARVRSQDERGRWSTTTYVYDEPDAAHAGEITLLPAGPNDRSPSDTSNAPAGDDMGITSVLVPSPTPENPTPESQAVIELLTTKNYVRSSRSYLRSGPRLCGHCHGQGVVTGPLGNVTTCSTCGGGMVLK